MTFKKLVKTLGRVLKYLKPYWKIVIMALVLTCIATGARLLQAKFVGMIMDLMTRDTTAVTAPAPKYAGKSIEYKDKVTITDPSSANNSNEKKSDEEMVSKIFSYEEGKSPFLALNIVCVSFIGLMSLVGVCTYFQKYTTEQCGQLAIRDFRSAVFKNLQRLPTSFFDKMRSGEIISRTTTDIITASGVFSVLAEFTKNFLIVVGCFTWMFYRDWQMTCVVILISPLVGMAISNFGKKMGQKTSILQARLADLSALQFENVSAINVVKAFSREQYETKRFINRNEDNYGAQMKVVQVNSMLSPVVELLSCISIVAIVWFGATRIMQGQVSFAQMTEYWTLMVMTGHPISVISSFYGTCQNAAAAAERSFAIMDAEPETANCENAQVLPELKGRIEFKDVTFEYEENKPVLNKLSFSIEPHEVVAVVGTNGSGKSTLVNMIPRFYSPNQGQILVDGVDIAKVDLASLRNQIGIVFQESILFRDTILENIRYGKLDANQEEIIQAGEIASVGEFAEKLPEKMATNVGERGSSLSGGQRQRVAIARALIKDPRILILDEYTSGVDAETEGLISEAIEKASENRTCIIIAHSLKTIRHANRILVMNNGSIAESGTHEELLKKGGIYKKIFESQIAVS